jgi:hypothetical protein
MSGQERKGHMLKRILAVAALVAGGVVIAPAAAQANLNYCYTNSICAYPSVTTWPAGSPWVINRDAADTPRNTCFAEFGTTQTFAVINNSKYRWYLFRTTTCGGSHIEVPPFTEMQTPSGWADIHGWYRTSSLT